VREEPCACGGVIRADATWQRSTEDIRHAVMEHNGLAIHRIWRHVLVDAQGRGERGTGGNLDHAMTAYSEPRP
jgi:hypothetical protein